MKIGFVEIVRRRVTIEWPNGALSEAHWTVDGYDFIHQNPELHRAINAWTKEPAGTLLPRATAKHRGAGG